MERDFNINDYLYDARKTIKQIQEEAYLQGYEAGYQDGKKYLELDEDTMITLESMVSPVSGLRKTEREAIESVLLVSREATQ